MIIRKINAILLVTAFGIILSKRNTFITLRIVFKLYPPKKSPAINSPQLMACAKKSPVKIKFPVIKIID